LWLGKTPQKVIFTVKSTYMLAKSKKIICFPAPMAREEYLIFNKSLVTGNVFGRYMPLRK
jgi:hypothetical protein